LLFDLFGSFSRGRACPAGTLARRFFGHFRHTVIIRLHWFRACNCGRQNSQIDTRWLILIHSFLARATLTLRTTRARRFLYFGHRYRRFRFERRSSFGLSRCHGTIARRATTSAARFGSYRNSSNLFTRRRRGFRLHLFAAWLIRLPVGATIIAAILTIAVPTIFAITIAIIAFATVVVIPATLLTLGLLAVTVTIAIAVPVTLLGIGVPVFIFIAAFDSVEVVAIRFGVPGALRLRLTLLALRFFLTGAVIGQHAEIVVGKLQIIFRVHPVAGQLRIARHVAVFFQQLGGIATRAVIDTIAVVTAAAVLATGTTIIVVPATIAAAGLTIINQWWFLVSK
jgi:hypothetical protein